jgi:anti-sigma factor RsiW
MTGHADAERLSSYLDDELDRDEAEWLAAHLETCDSCRAQLEGLRRVMGDLRSLEKTTPPAGLGLRLQQRLAREAPPYHDHRGVLGYRAPKVLFQPAVLASLAVILALGVIMVMFTHVLSRDAPWDFRGGTEGETAPVELGERVEVGGRVFEVMGGMWVESDLTVAEVTEARRLARADLLAETGDDPEVRAILERLEKPVTMRLGEGTVRVPASAD